ncbi:MAG: hypothetical protein LC640_05960 [Frankia sp.]|nr:hypothetical protein [Frankia sp.]
MRRAVWLIAATVVLTGLHPASAAPRRATMRPPYADAQNQRDESCATTSTCRVDVTAFVSGRMASSAAITEQTPTLMDERATGLAAIVAGVYVLRAPRRQVTFTFRFTDVNARATASSVTGTAGAGVSVVALAAHFGCRDCKAATATKVVATAAESMGTAVTPPTSTSHATVTVTVTLRRAGGSLPAGPIGVAAGFGAGAVMGPGFVCVESTCVQSPLPHTGAATATGSAVLSRVEVVES